MNGISLKKILLIVLSFGFFAGSNRIAEASALKRYKQQKHKPTQASEGVVTVSCFDEYTRQCQLRCSSVDSACKSKCVDEAPAYCSARNEQKKEEQMKLLLQALTLLAPVVAIAFDEPRQFSDAEEIDPYAFYWDRPSVHAFTGFGFLNEGAKSYVFDVTARYGYFGFTANYSHLYDSETQLTEMDYGPSVFFGSKRVMAGFSPSFLVSKSPGERDRTGFGLRAPAVVAIEQFHIHYNPLLGKINDQWFFQFKIGGGYRVTPSLAMSIGYEYRKIIDLEDLTLSSADLQGAFLYMSYRFN